MTMLYGIRRDGKGIDQFPIVDLGSGFSVVHARQLGAQLATVYSGCRKEDRAFVWLTGDDGVTVKCSADRVGGIVVPTYRIRGYKGGVIDAVQYATDCGYTVKLPVLDDGAASDGQAALVALENARAAAHSAIDKMGAVDTLHFEIDKATSASEFDAIVASERGRIAALESDRAARAKALEELRGVVSDYAMEHSLYLPSAMEITQAATVEALESIMLSLAGKVQAKRDADLAQSAIELQAVIDSRGADEIAARAARKAGKAGKAVQA